ncbi:Putative adhesin domain-containing protein OS=Streptomyces lavendulae subsp. lavendulae OX=58340 GN=SLAV_10445 PE=4 SV=1 [Streptomyces lavendulae subsp. lavendulae]
MKIRMRMSLVAGVVTLGVLVPLLTACEQYDESESKTFDVSEKATSVSVDSGGGNVQVVQGDGETVKVTEDAKYASGKKPKTEHYVTDGKLTLKVGSDCRDGISDADCSVDYKVEVPSGVAVTVRSGGGTVGLTGVTGAVDVSSGGGEVKAKGLAASKLKAVSSGGTIDVNWVKPPDDVNVEAKGGNVTVRVPDDSYNVSANTSLGSEKVEVKSSSTASRRIVAHTFAGDVKVLVTG